MNIVFIDTKTGRTRTVRGYLLVLTVALLVFFSLLCGAGLYALQKHYSPAVSPFLLKPTNSLARALQADAKQTHLIVDEVKRDAQQQMIALSIRMAELQARVMRIDALGERLLNVANLDQSEFVFSKAPPVGGPEGSDELEADLSFEKPSFLAALDDLAADVEQREEQLEILESLLENMKFQRAAYLAGRPIRQGWMSSRFGRRTDPFTGRLSWHKGIDFAAREGSEIISVGSGVVTWAGRRFGYGNMVEINHGPGLATRYAHAKKVLVKVGDVVERGQTVALIGNSGRSTGPHVHFEVRRDGQAVDPARYVNREE